MTIYQAIVASVGYLKSDYFREPLVIHAVQSRNGTISVLFTPNKGIRNDRRLLLDVAHAVFFRGRIALEPVSAFVETGRVAEDAAVLKLLASAMCSELLQSLPRDFQFQLSISKSSTSSDYTILFISVPYVPDSFTLYDASFVRGKIKIVPRLLTPIKSLPR